MRIKWRRLNKERKRIAKNDKASVQLQNHLRTGKKKEKQKI